MDDTWNKYGNTHTHEHVAIQKKTVTEEVGILTRDGILAAPFFEGITATQISSG
jgi:hypothetical protein